MKLKHVKSKLRLLGHLKKYELRKCLRLKLKFTQKALDFNFWVTIVGHPKRIDALKENGVSNFNRPVKTYTIKERRSKRGI